MSKYIPWAEIVFVYLGTPVAKYKPRACLYEEHFGWQYLYHLRLVVC